MMGFTKFVREQGVIGLGIAVVLGGAVGRVITSLVDDIIQPIIGFLIGSPEGLAKLHFKSIMYGNFISALIDFVIVAGVIFIVLKKFGLDKLDKPREKVDLPIADRSDRLGAEESNGSVLGH